LVLKARLQLAYGLCELAHRLCDPVIGYLLCYVRWLDSQKKMRAKKLQFNHIVVKIYRVKVVLFIIGLSILVGWPMRELFEWLFFCRPRGS
jgi:hypothetical protein